MPTPVTILEVLLAQLRALHWFHWTAHWQTEGQSFYGDHLMFGRMYEAITEEIHALAEKMVAMFGPRSVDDRHQMALAANILAHHIDMSLLDRAFSLEESLQQNLQSVFTALEEQGDMSLGLNDFLAAVANTHETHMYLLKQRMRGTRIASRVALRYLVKTDSCDRNPLR